MEATIRADPDTGEVCAAVCDPPSQPGLGADRSIEWGGHLLFAVLMAAGLVRTILHTDGSLVPAVAGASVVSGWYLYGVLAISVRHQRLGAPWALLLVVGWIALTVISPDFVWLAFVLAMLCWHFLPLPVAIAAELVIVAASVLASVRTDPVGVGAVIGPVIGIATAVAVTEAVHRVVDAAAARDALSRQLARTQLRLAAQEHEAAVLAERDRIGSEIHDGAGQALAGIVMLLQSATDPARPARQRAVQTATALEMASTALAQTRTFLRGLDDPPGAPDALADGLRTAVDHARSLGLPTDLHLHLHGIALRVDAADRALLLRAAQEALANAARHADAGRAVVTLTVLEDEAHLDVVDDGRGFDPARTDTGTGFGLRALATRVGKSGGTLTVDSEPGEGTVVHVHLPVREDVE